MGERWQGPWRPPLRGFRAASHASGVHKRDCYGLSMRRDFNHECWLSIQYRLVMTRGGSEGGPMRGQGSPMGGQGSPMRGQGSLMSAVKVINNGYTGQRQARKCTRG